MMLSTNRLDLIPAALEHVSAELEDPQRLASILNARIEPGWPPGEYDRGAQEFFRERLKEGGAHAAGWYSWYAVRRADDAHPSVLVGAAGYFGPPNENGEVEIGLSVMPVWQGKGFATEIIKALIENAFNDSRVRTIIAHTTTSNVASCRALEKCAFRRVHEDETSGDICFEISRK